MTGLLVAVDRLADQVRALPHSRLRRGVAAEVLDLARELSLRAQRRECPEREPLRMPDAGPFAVADQVAVAGHDLVVAHLAHPRRPEDGAADALAAEKALVEATARRCGLR